ncbi:MAG: acetate--CoA ligase family protein [Deferrisomatales bacterium]
MAFVGASAGFGKWGHSLFANLVAGGYRGGVHLVNPRGGTIAGRPAVVRVADLPDGVDLAVVSVPAREVPALMPQLAARGIRSAVVVSSGFREAGEDDLEARLVAEARAAGVTVVGPNTMGILNPHAGVYCTGAHVRPLPGGVTLVSQSGNMGVQLLSFAAAQGLGIRAFCGTGNEAMATVEDFVEALEGDRETRVVVLYLEGVKDGRRFYDAVRRLGRVKPVVALKGGRTAAGQRAAASHTGALAADEAVFEAACRQAGVVLVTQPADLLDVPAALSALPLPRGNRVAIMTWGGGWGGVVSDLCAELGLEVPPLAPELVARLDRLLPPYWSRTNPVDLVGEPDLELPGRVLEELLAWDGVDAVIHLGMLGRRPYVLGLIDSVRRADPDIAAAFLATVDQASEAYERECLAQSLRLMERHGKPVIGVSLMPDGGGRTLHEVAGVPGRAVVFPTPERAAKVLAHLWGYQRFRSRGG